MKVFENIDFKFQNTQQFKTLIEKWGFDENDLLNYFDDLIDDGVIFNFKQSITDYEKDKNKFNIVILLYFEYTFSKVKYNDTGEFTSSYLYNFSDYKKFIEKQNKIFTDIESSVKRFVDAEHLIISKAGTGISKIPFHMSQDERNKKLKVHYRLVSEIESSDANLEYEKFKKRKNPLGEHRDALISKLVEDGIHPEFANQLIDVNPGYEDEEEENVFFGFLTDDEIIVIASYDKKTERGNIIRDEYERAVNSFYEGHCSDILGNGYLDRNDG